MISNRFGFLYVNHETCAPLSEDLRMDHSLRLVNNDYFIGGHGCQWIDVVSPVSEQPWNIADVVNQSCSIDMKGCDRYKAHLIGSYTQNRTGWFCYVSVDASFESEESLLHMQDAIRLFNKEEFAGYWFGGNSYDEALEAFYTNSFVSVRSPAAYGSDWLNAFTWCSYGGSPSGAGGAMLDLLRQNNNNFTEARQVISMIGNQYGLVMNNKETCFDLTEDFNISRPLKLIGESYIGTHGCSFIGNVDPRVNNGWVLADKIWKVCNKDGCDGSQLYQIGTYNTPTHSSNCYMALDGIFAESSDSIQAFAETLRQYLFEENLGWRTDTNEEIGQAGTVVSSFMTLRSQGSGKDIINSFMFCVAENSPGRLDVFTATVFQSLRNSNYDFVNVYNHLLNIAAEKKIWLEKTLC